MDGQSFILYFMPRKKAIQKRSAIASKASVAKRRQIPTIELAPQVENSCEDDYSDMGFYYSNDDDFIDQEDLGDDDDTSDDDDMSDDDRINDDANIIAEDDRDFNLSQERVPVRRLAELATMTRRRYTGNSRSNLYRRKAEHIQRALGSQLITNFFPPISILHEDGPALQEDDDFQIVAPLDEQADNSFQEQRCSREDQIENIVNHIAKIKDSEKMSDIVQWLRAIQRYWCILLHPQSTKRSASITAARETFSRGTYTNRLQWHQKVICLLQANIVLGGSVI